MRRDWLSWQLAYVSSDFVVPYKCCYYYWHISVAYVLQCTSQSCSMSLRTVTRDIVLVITHAVLTLRSSCLLVCHYSAHKLYCGTSITNDDTALQWDSPSMETVREHGRRIWSFDKGIEYSTSLCLRSISGAQFAFLCKIAINYMLLPIHFCNNKDE